jgi:hypothetical protein
MYQPRKVECVNQLNTVELVNLLAPSVMSTDIVPTMLRVVLLVCAGQVFTV